MIVDDLYCKLYLDANLERRPLVEMIANIVQGDVVMNEVRSNVFDLYIRKNEFAAENSADFIKFRFYIEAEVSQHFKGTPLEYKKKLADLIQRMLNLGFKVIPACSFEDELPHS